MHGSDISWRILQKKLYLPQWNLISEISSKCLHNLLLSEEMIHQNNNNEPPLISTHLRSPNVREFLYSILFLLLVARYLVRTHLLLVSRAYSELQTEFEKVKFFMIPSYMIELRKLLDRYPTTDSFSIHQGGFEKILPSQEGRRHRNQIHLFSQNRMARLKRQIRRHMIKVDLCLCPST